MKRSWILTLVSFFKSRSKTPWVCFESTGLGENGIEVALHWNRAAIDQLHSMGIQGADDQETLQLFYMYVASSVSPAKNGDTVSSEAHPFLSNESNSLVK